MLKRNVSKAEHALAYITDCNLATVADLAMKKRKSKSEYERQISIAQHAIDWMNQFGVNFESTRAADVMACGGSVKDWISGLDQF